MQASGVCPASGPNGGANQQRAGSDPHRWGAAFTRLGRVLRLLTRITFDEIYAGLALPIDTARLAATGQVEPGPGRGFRPIHKVQPRDLLQAFLSARFESPLEIEGYLNTYGIPVKWYGLLGDEPHETAPVIAFEQLAELAGPAVPPDRLAALWADFLEGIGYRPTFYSIDELRDLQERVRLAAQPMLETATAKRLPDDSAFLIGTLNFGLQGTRLRLKLDMIEVHGKSERALTLTAADTYEFETALWLGVLQRIIERRPIRPCDYCGRYFDMNERRSDHRFCNRSCKQRWHNQQGRLKRDLASCEPTAFTPTASAR